jgi:hypothetical protein
LTPASNVSAIEFGPIAALVCRNRTFLTFTQCGDAPMITSQGYGLIAELIAAALLIAALTSLFVQRSKPWLVGVTMAFVILTVAATVVIASPT